jgi:hypothetical protein
MALPFQDDTRRAGDTLDVVEAWLADPGPPAVFLWVHLFDAHSPYDPPAEHAAAYWPSDMDPRDPSLPDPGLPEIMLAPAKLQGLRNLDYPFASYEGEVSWAACSSARRSTPASSPSWPITASPSASTGSTSATAGSTPRRSRSR